MRNKCESFFSEREQFLLGGFMFRFFLAFFRAGRDEGAGGGGGGWGGDQVHACLLI